MTKGKTSVSTAKSYREIGEFWDTHDLADFWDRTQEVQFEVGMESETTYYAIDKTLSEQLQFVAQKRGISADTLVNLSIQEKLKGANA